MSSEYAEELDLELTAEEEEQLNAIERDLALSAAAPAIAASPPSHPPAASAYMPPAPSLYDTYRRTRGWGSLSVSDLTSLIWCETRLGYSLSSRAHLPTADRPTSLISTNGVEVRLDARRSQARDAILEKGRVVHQVLEDALLVDVVQVVEVVAKDKEEWWTLKILDTMANLERLLQTGVVREVPVFGMVHGLLIFGVIDQIDRRETTSSPTKLSAKAAEKREATMLEEYLGVQGSSDKLEEVAWSFVLSDTKTRHSNSLPPKPDSRSSRLQIMLYHRLFTTLLTGSSLSSNVLPTLPSSFSPSAFPWTEFYAQLHLDSSALLSPDFLTAIKPLLAVSSLGGTLEQAMSLADFAVVLQQYGELLRGGEGRAILDDALEISYRLRNDVKGWKESRADRRLREQEKARGEEISRGELAAEQTEEEIAMREIELAEEDLGGIVTLEAGPVERMDALDGAALDQMYESSDSGEEGEAAVLNYLFPSLPLRSPSPSPPPSPLLQGAVIGCESFTFDAVELDDWLLSATSLWKGERAAVGVSIEQTNRCRTCEFEDGCEWRTAKAIEMAQKMSNRTQ